MKKIKTQFKRDTFNTKYEIFPKRSISQGSVETSVCVCVCVCVWGGDKCVCVCVCVCGGGGGGGGGNAFFAPNVITSPKNHTILQPIIDFGSLSVQHKKDQVYICFEYQVIKRQTAQSLRKTKYQDLSIYDMQVKENIYSYLSTLVQYNWIPLKYFEFTPGVQWKYIYVNTCAS